MEDAREYDDGKRIININLCNLNHKNQSKFLQMCQIAMKNGVNALEFVKIWNNYAQDITEHVFWSIKQRESKEMFTERGK